MRRFKSLEHLPGPPSCSNIEQQSAGRICDIARLVTGQSQPYVILRKENGSDSLPDLRFVLSHPEKFWKSETRDGGVADKFDETRRTDRFGYLDDFVSSSLIAPEESRTKNLIAFIEQNGAMHLTGKTERSDLGRIDAGTFQGAADRFT
jgi:hypothetical protein